jgi:DNA (cytosine-5)-methyltransferase 1
MEKESFTFIDLFAGIGGLRIPFQEMGGKCVFSSEINEQARETYRLNFGEIPSGDITEINASDIPEHDILLAGFPCQAFSIMGNGLGFADTRGTLFFDIERILREKRPKAFLLENVKQLASHDKKRTFKVITTVLTSLGYSLSWAILDARKFGLPQKRERTFIVGFKDYNDFKMPDSCGPTLRLEDILLPEPSVPKKYFASEYIKARRQEQTKGKRKIYPSIWHENKSGNVSIHPYSCALRANGSHNYILVNGNRLLAPKELLALQGFPEDFIIAGSYAGVRRQVGNSVAVPVVRAIGKAMIRSIFPPEMIDDERR